MSNPTAKVMDVVDAVIVRLNQQPTPFFLPFTACFTCQPLYDIKELTDGLKITVLPSNEADTVLNRVKSQEDVDIDVGIQEKLTGSKSNVDNRFRDLQALAEQFKTLLKLPNPPDGLGPLSLPNNTNTFATWLGMVPRPLWHYPHMLESRVFTRVLTFTYRLKIAR